MPRVKRRAMNLRAWTREHLRHLCTGLNSVFGNLQSLNPEQEFDEDAARTCWQEFRADILERWVELNPGTRCWGWWRWEAPERRRRIGSWRLKRDAQRDATGCYDDDSDRFVRDKKPHPFDNPKRKALVSTWEAEHPGPAEAGYGLYFGQPVCCIVEDDYEAAYETEAAYLDRLGLAVGDECERWKTAQYQEGTEVYAMPDAPNLSFIDALLED